MSKVGSISKAQKAQNFWKKMSHSVENVKGGTVLDLSTYIPLQNIKKTRKGGPFGDMKNFRKVAVPELL